MYMQINCDINYWFLNEFSIILYYEIIYIIEYIVDQIFNPDYLIQILKKRVNLIIFKSSYII